MNPWRHFKDAELETVRVALMDAGWGWPSRGKNHEDMQARRLQVEAEQEQSRRKGESRLAKAKREGGKR